MEPEVFGRVLAAVDGSRESMSAVETVLDLSIPITELRIVRVEEPGCDDEHTDTAVSELLARCRENGAAGSAIELRTGPDGVADAILREIGEFRPGLIAIGSKGTGDLGSLLHGSVSHRILHGVTSCPVLVVRGDGTAAPGRRRILLALGGQRSDATAIQTAMRLAVAIGAEIVVLHVLRSLSEVGTSTFINPLDAQSQLLTPALMALRDRGLSAESVVVGGDAAAQIVSLASAYRANLIVMGHGGLLQGDVRTGVIQMSRLPVVVSPPPPARRARRAA